MDNFFNKYTRFITKDIYIGHNMYSNFLRQYDYLYQILKKDCFLYSDNKKYKKIMDIIENKTGLIKLHNQKYLQGALKKHQSFFEKVYSKDKLDVRKQSIILSEEENVYVIQPKNKNQLIVGKLKYLIDCKNYAENSILVLTDSEEEIIQIKEECINKDINITIETIKDYGKKLLQEEFLLDDNKKYDILIKYIMNDLFSDKSKFNIFYKAFAKYIYLNKDYKEYETFRDYHNYMYKRKYLSSGFTLKKFNKEEIKKRKTYLRTIKNESLKQKEEVDIANFLYLNSIPYTYDSNKSLFKIRLLEKENIVKYFNGKEVLEEKNNYLDNNICLYSSYVEDKTYLEVLAYELIKRSYPLELVDEETLYTQLKNTNIENYFSEFIYKYLIPLINYYDENKNLTNINISDLAIQEFLSLYEKYNNYLDEYRLITKKQLLKRIEKEILAKKYKYLFLIGDISLNCNIPTFTIVSDYQETELLKENIKLLYDYKKYLYENQAIPIAHTYLNKGEINFLTKKFLKDNLSIINKSLEETTKEIKIYEYDDNNRLHIYRNISDCCSNILKQQSKETLVAFNHLKDINILINNNKFTKIDKNTLLTNDKVKINVEEILKIDKIYNTIILPYLIVDCYHEELFKNDYQYNVKVMLYVALNKCRKDLIILCPSSKRKEVDQLLGNLKKQVIKS